MPKSTPVFVEGRDYYVENGLYVFTEHYLKQRGYCCGSGCRHCPYGPLVVETHSVGTTTNTANGTSKD